MVRKPANLTIVEDVTSQINKVLNSLLQNQIVIPQPDEVREYLIRYPDIIELLLSVCKTALKQLGKRAQLSLEVYHDPEIKDEYLTLYVRQEHYDSHIMDMIENICAKYESELVGKSGWLLVTTDFQPPEPR